MVHMANGMGEAAATRLHRAGARHFVKSQLRAGGDQQVVVIQCLPVQQRQLAGVGVDVGHRLADEADFFARQIRRNRQGDRLALAPAHRDPRVAGHKLEVVGAVDHRDAVLLGQHFTQFVGGGHAANACTHDDDMSHVLSPVI